jgi:hypothetical protein
MTKEEKIEKIKELKIKAADVKREVEYYDSLQQGLKLVVFSPVFA